MARDSAPLLLGVLALFAGACDSLSTTGVDDDYAALDLESEYTWIFDRWNQGTPEGFSAVQLTWDLPARYEDQVFRVYSRGGNGGYVLIATVSSCSAGMCTYTDRNVQGGASYDYYIATVDERTGNELATSDAIQVDVPTRGNIPVPTGLTAVALDNAVFLRWTSSSAQRYMIVSALENGETFLIGETDGTSYLDTRATNGTRARYFIAGVDENDHVGALSSSVDAFPRPDYHADIVFVHADDASSSGFRFVTNPATENPIVSGTATTAQWRLIESGGVLRIEPLGSTQVTSGTFTTALTCGAGAEPDCVDIRTAPTTGFASGPVPIQAGHTYVFRLMDSSARIRYAKIRVAGPATNSSGRRLMVFDWAFQTRIDERALSRAP